MIIDARRDHSIRVPRPDLSVSLGVPNACNGCHADKSPQWAADKLKSWRGDSNLGFQHFAETLDAGTQGAPGARDRLLSLAQDPANPGIARATAVARLNRVSNSDQRKAVQDLLKDPDPLVRRAAAGAYASLPPMLRRDLLALLDDPIRDVRLEAAQRLAILPAQSLSEKDALRRDAAVNDYIASQRRNADRPEAHHNLGILFQQLGQAPEAETEFRKALALDPDFVPAAITLADLYRATGREALAEPILRGLVARQPGAAAVHHALGLWLVRAGSRQEAIVELQKASELAPESARYSYVYSVAIAGIGDRQHAFEILQASLARHPFDRDSLFAAAGYARDLGHTDVASRYANELGKLEPDDPNVQKFVNQMRD
jgi:Tfp pilus assembly protein PilF